MFVFISLHCFSSAVSLASRLLILSHSFPSSYLSHPVNNPTVKRINKYFFIGLIIYTPSPNGNFITKRKRGTVRIICFRGSGKPVVQDKTTPHANHVYNEYIYGKHERLYRQSPYHMKFTRFLKTG